MRHMVGVTALRVGIIASLLAYFPGSYIAYYWYGVTWERVKAEILAPDSLWSARREMCAGRTGRVFITARPVRGLLTGPALRLNVARYEDAAPFESYQCDYEHGWRLLFRSREDVIAQDMLRPVLIKRCNAQDGSGTEHDLVQAQKGYEEYKVVCYRVKGIWEQLGLG
jgi:hypothetical protein